MSKKILKYLSRTLLGLFTLFWGLVTWVALTPAEGYHHCEAGHIYGLLITIASFIAFCLVWYLTKEKLMIKIKKTIENLPTFRKRKEIYEQEYKWIPSFVQELGFTNISYTNHGLNQTFYHQNKDQKIYLSIELSPRKREWDVINIQLNSNKKDSIILIKKWGVRKSSLHNEDWKKDIRNVSEAFFSVDVSFGEKESLFLDCSLKLEDIYIVPPHAVIVCSMKIEDLIIKAFNLGCKKLSNVRPLKIECGLAEGIDKNGRCTGKILWEDQFVGTAHIEERVLGQGEFSDSSAQGDPFVLWEILESGGYRYQIIWRNNRGIETQGQELFRSKTIK